MLRHSVQTMEDLGPANFANEDWAQRWHIKQSSFAYDKACPFCSTVVTVLTQEDNEPEYYTDIYVVCGQCKHKVRFMLPVN